MDAMLKELADITIPIIAIIGLFTFLAVASYADARRRERESHHRNEFRKALVEKWGSENTDKLLELLREESKASETSHLLDLLRNEKPVDPQRRKERLILTGLVTTALGIGLAIGLHFIDVQNLWTLGLIPLLVGVAVLIHAFLFCRV